MDLQGLFLFIVLGGIALYLIPIIWVLASGPSYGLAKFGWFIISLFFSWVGLAAYLIFTQAHKEILAALDRNFQAVDDAPTIATPIARQSPSSRGPVVQSSPLEV